MAETAVDPILADFRNFLYLVWEHVSLPAPTPLQYNAALEIQHGTDRDVIEAFRGVGKSWITSAYVCWRLLDDPQLKVLVVSASKERANDWTTFTQRLIREMPVLEHLQPREGQRDSKISFDVGPARAAHAPSVKSVGITGQITGSRANLIIPDDVEVPGNSATPVMREKLEERIKEFESVLTPGGRILFLGTPQCEESVYNGLPAKGYRTVIYPGRFPTEKQLDTYGNKIAPWIVDQLARGAKPGDPTEPRRFSDEDLMRREASMGRSTFQLQFMLDTHLADMERYPLRLNDLVVMSLDSKRGPVQVAWGGAPDLVIQDLHTIGFNGDRYHRPAWVLKDAQGNPDYAEYTGSIMFIDPSGRGKDECAYAVVKILYGTLFLMASGGFINGYDEKTLHELASIAVRYGVNKILCEPNFGDGMFTALLKPVVTRIATLPTGGSITVEDSEWKGTQKEMRIIDTLEPVMNQHRLVVAEDVIKTDWTSIQKYPSDDQLKYSLFYQLTRITREKGALVRDDRLDALAGAVSYWLEHMARDTRKAGREHRAELLDAELEHFMDHALGRKPSVRTMVDVPGRTTYTRT